MEQCVFSRCLIADFGPVCSERYIAHDLDCGVCFSRGSLRGSLGRDTLLKVGLLYRYLGGFHFHVAIANNSVAGKALSLLCRSFHEKRSDVSEQSKK